MTGQIRIRPDKLIFWQRTVVLEFRKMVYAPLVHACDLMHFFGKGRGWLRGLE